MACPFFVPRAPLSGFSDIYGGTCAAQAGATIHDGLLENCCNNGYARSECPRAAQSESDAYRFMIKAHTNGVVEVAWSSERNHHPVAVGVVSVCADAAAQTPLEQQARVYAAAFLQQSGLDALPLLR